MPKLQDTQIFATDRMIQRFFTRTEKHIELVMKNLTVMTDFKSLSRRALEGRGISHDRSKFEHAERLGYTWLTWWYDRKAAGTPCQYPDGVEGVVEGALEHHRRTNRHHPEAHRSPNAMGLLDVVEMVCDWTAISQELSGEFGSCTGWAAVNIEMRWDFSSPKKALIFETIRELDRRNLERVGSTISDQMRKEAA